MLLKRFQSSKHRYILPLGFMLIIAMMIFTSFYTTTLSNTNKAQIINTVKQKSLNTKLLRDMSRAISERSIVLNEMIQTSDPFKRDELFTKFNNIATDYVVAKTALKNQASDKQLKQLFEKLEPITRSNGALQNSAYDLVLNNKHKEVISLFVNEIMPRQKRALDIIRKMEIAQYKAAQSSIHQTEKESEKDYTTLLFFNFASIFASILLTIVILKKQKKNDDKLYYLANTDTLTGLPNRNSFIRKVEKTILYQKQTFAVAFFDIDNFKSINDNYGHETGDKIIKAFSRKIEEYLKPDDVLSRFGGDEFVLMLQSITSKEEAVIVISKLSKALDTTFIIDGNEIFVSSSIGVSLYDDSIVDADSLFRNADIAMYTAKKLGRNCYQFFSREARDKLEQEHATCHALQTVLKDNNEDKQLHLKYQPLINIETGTITECEALIRWINPKGEIITPDEFIPLAEKSNLIKKVNRFVIDEACKQQNEWRKSGINNIRININLSGNKLIFNTLLKQFKYNINKYNLSPADFGIELTERTLHEISSETIKELDLIRQQGMKISIDDFGTGYSSLSYLKKLPITTLKIDKGFIDDLPEDKDDQALVKAIISLGHALNLDIVAEGVETSAQLQFLQENACNIAQGYYLHHPLDSEQLSQLRFVA